MKESLLFALVLSLLSLIGFEENPKTHIPVRQEVEAGRPSHVRARSEPVVLFDFDGTVENATDTPLEWIVHGRLSYEDGLDGLALNVGQSDAPSFLELPVENLPFDGRRDFSVQFWMRTEAQVDNAFVVLSQKAFKDKSLASQKLPGWVFYVSGGTWAWNMGSGTRRITYERDNGKRMSVNDGKWHQLTMSYSSARAEVRLFSDGVNWVTYHVSDSNGFEFTSLSPMVVGWDGQSSISDTEILPAIRNGAAQLQTMVDAFNGFGLTELESDEFVHLVVDPRRLFEQKVDEEASKRGADSLLFKAAMDDVDWEPVANAESALMANPYTVHQVLNFMETAPLSKIYNLVDGEVVIRRDAAATYAKKERLHAPEFYIDNLVVWDRELTAEEVRSSYADFYEPHGIDLEEKLSSLTAADWNIWHGGKHFTVSDQGWDSRLAIAEMLADVDADIIMMQETYSSGDFIAAELGYYYATTVDWDYLNQGSNISILSRYPITELHVQEGSPFNNVGAKITISTSQDLYAMSNWYGMSQFPAVFEFHASRFDESDVIPTLFAGDFNAVPHTDGGDSPASRELLQAGFTDAFRSLYPDAQKYPGPTHRNGRRIDQLYFKGAGLKNMSTKVVSTRPSGFPSDHFLIVSNFDLNYSTQESDR